MISNAKTVNLPERCCGRGGHTTPARIARCSLLETVTAKLHRARDRKQLWFLLKYILRYRVPFPQQNQNENIKRKSQNWDHNYIVLYYNKDSVSSYTVHIKIFPTAPQMSSLFPHIWIPIKVQNGIWQFCLFSLFLLGTVRLFHFSSCLLTFFFRV